METKDLLGLILLPSACLAGVIMASLSQRARDAAFFFLVAGCVLAERLNINFLSHYWYRGTSRGFEFSFVDVLAVSVLVSSWFFPRDKFAGRYWPISLAPLILYFLYGCFSVAISQPKLYGSFELLKWARGLVVFLAAACFVRSEREVRILVLALGCAVGIEGVSVLKQRYVSGLYRVTGTLDHANSLSMYLCMVGPVLAAATVSALPRLLRYFSAACLGLTALSILCTVSRAGIPIFLMVVLGTIVFTGSLRFSLKHLFGFLCLCVLLVGLIASQWVNLKARYQIERSLEEEYFDERSEGRGHYFLLAKAILGDQFLGVGLNNWSYWVCKKYGAERGWFYEDYDDLDYIPPKEALPDIHYAPPAHNLAALVAGELGGPGLFLFALVWMRWLRAGRSFLRRRSPEAASLLGAGIFFSICGVFLQSVTEWVFLQPPILFSFYILMGTLASLYQQRRSAQRRESEAIPIEEGQAFEFQTAEACVQQR